MSRTLVCYIEGYASFRSFLLDLSIGFKYTFNGTVIKTMQGLYLYLAFDTSKPVAVSFRSMKLKYDYDFE